MVEQVDDETYYDFHVPELENYLACGLIHHNSGKTALLASMAEQDMIAGHTVIVMEPKGDLFYETLARVPEHRRGHVIIVDLQDVAHPVGFNFMQQGNPRIAVSNIKELFEQHFPEIARGINVRQMLHRGMLTLITDPKSSFVDIVPLFSPSMRTEAENAWRDDLIANVTDYDLKEYWLRQTKMSKERGGDAKQEQDAQPLLNRAWIITETPELRNIFGQSASSFTFEDVFKDGKIVLINLSGVPSDAASLAGTILMQSMWQAIQTFRGQLDRSSYLYLDEFQSFMKLPIGAEEMLAKARSFKLGMRLAHQNLDQLNGLPELRGVIKANARNKVLFKLSADDANQMARELGPLVKQTDLQNLKKYEAYAQVVTDEEGVSQPFSMRTYAPTEAKANVEAIRLASRQKYGRPVEQVIEEMRARRRGPASGPSKRTRPATWEGEAE